MNSLYIVQHCYVVSILTDLRIYLLTYIALWFTAPNLNSVTTSA